MCGISGILNWSNKVPACKKELQKLQSGIGHRGPDGEGIFIYKNIGLCHKRLSIIDINDGTQPMISSDGNIIIVFNGEIYNYLELRSQLKSKGHAFQTNSDTEVIIQAYIEWGELCVNYFNGMWAFAILDKRKDPIIFCSRDRIGIKPFYYRLDELRFIFSSEIKAFKGVYNFKFKFNKEIVWDCLVYGPKSKGETIVDSIIQLEPGSNMLIKNGKVDIYRYYIIEESFENQKNVINTHEIKQLLTDSIKLRLRSDVPLATINSGGLDSSLISAISSKQIDNLYTYSVCPEKPEEYMGHLPGDERKFAELLAKFIQSKHKTILYNSEIFISYLSKTIHSNDGELYHSNSVPLNYMLHHISKDGIKVVLGGEGADEIFGGYYSNRIMNLSRYLGKYIVKKIVFRKFPHKKYLEKEFINFRRMIPLLRSSHFSPTHANKILKETCDIHQDRNEIFYNMSHMSPENALSYYEQKCYLAGLLQRADRMSMVNQIELRVPFLDHRLVNLMNGISPSLKSGVSRKSEKQILKHIANGIVPQSIINRKKYGFGSPLFLYRDHLLDRLKNNKYFNNNNNSIEQLWLLNTIISNQEGIEYEN